MAASIQNMITDFTHQLEKNCTEERERLIELNQLMEKVKSQITSCQSNQTIITRYLQQSNSPAINASIDSTNELYLLTQQVENVEKTIQSLNQKILQNEDTCRKEIQDVAKIAEIISLTFNMIRCLSINY